MSDTESITAVPAHPTLGGKSLESLQRPRYKSWRKKYRKIHFKFDEVMEENKRLWKEEYKLQQIAKRLKEELDGLMELCLTFNETPNIPPELRFNVKLPRHQNEQSVVPEDLLPEDSARLLAKYEDMVHDGRVPQLDLHVVRKQIDERLADREVRDLEDLARDIPTPIPTMAPSTDGSEAEKWTSFFTSAEEDAYLTKQYAIADRDPWRDLNASLEGKEIEQEKLVAEMTPRELDKHIELLNPQSQHNWLRAHNKSQPVPDDNDSLASQEAKLKKKTKNLAKQVGDRAVERAREGWSPGAGSAYDEDELGFIDEYPSASGKKRGRDPDTTYRVKGGKGGGGASSTKPKRKRASGDDAPYSNGSGAKKPRVETSGE